MWGLWHSRCASLLYSKIQPTEPYPVHPAPTIVLVRFWDAPKTCSFSVLSYTLHFWSTDLLGALPVQSAITVAFWTAFFWAVSLELQTSKRLLPKTHASTPQQRQSGIYFVCKNMAVQTEFMWKERIAPAVTCLVCLNTCAYCPYVFLYIYICHRYHASAYIHHVPFLPPQCWCAALYLVK